MLVICDGMVRSASTWSFNVAMGLLRRSTERSRVYGGYDEDLAHFLESIPPAATHAVLKCHALDRVGRGLARTGAIQVIFTWRNIADAVVSFMTMFGHDFEHSLSVIGSALELYRFHRESGNAVILGYAEITAHPANAIRRIAAYLGLVEDPKTIAEVAQETSFERMREKVEELDTVTDERRLIRRDRYVYDRETLLNLHHIRDGSSGYGCRILSADQLARISDLVQRYDLPE